MSINKILGAAIQSFGHGLQEGGCHQAVEDTNRYFEELQQTADELNDLHHQIDEQREAITLLMRFQNLTGGSSDDNKPKAKIIELKP